MKEDILNTKNDIKSRFQALLHFLNEGVWEKGTEIGMGLLAAVAGESVLLLGPPGVAKSMVARRIKSAFCDAQSFEYLMSRFSTPDEIFGPVSINRLKSADIYERNTAGFMPSSDIVFLDEIWKAGPAILNTLLTIINEKTFRNGREEMRVPLKLLIGASNELPAEGEGLEALWDRFLVRLVSGCVKNEDNFYKILKESPISADESKADIPADMAISQNEYLQWQKQISAVDIDIEVLKAITYIRQHTKRLVLSDDAAEGATRIHSLYISDRRWKHIVHLLRASAFVHGRTSVTVADILPLVHCLWNEPEELPYLRPIVVQSVFVEYSEKISKLSADMSLELRRLRALRALQQIKEENYHRDDNKQLFDNFYYRIDKYGIGNTYIFFVDYKHLQGYSRDVSPVEAIVYADPQNPKRNLITLMADAAGLLSNGVQAVRVKLYRDDNNIYINGVQYPIGTLPRGQYQTPMNTSSATQSETDYEAMVEALAANVRQTAQALISDNMFVSHDDKLEVERQTKSMNHEIAILRMNLSKVLYE